MAKQLSGDEFRLYELIWKRTVASQMGDAKGSTATIRLGAFVARQIPCEMCKDIPCVVACPTGALSKDLTDIRDAKMGVAVLTGPDTCYSVTGRANCRACYLACPIKDQAITMEPRQAGARSYFEPTVHKDACTGCGKCEHACVTAEASIKVLPDALARHDLVEAR